MEKTVQIKKVSSSDLALRDIADSFFNELESMPQEKIRVDFSDVRSISRSFAHQFFVRKSASHKTITEINVPENVEKMFRVVDNNRNNSRLLDLDSMQVETI